MMLFDQHDAEVQVYQIAFRRSDRSISLHCLTARSALCAVYEIATGTITESQVDVSLDGTDLSVADLQIRAMAERPFETSVAG